MKKAFVIASIVGAFVLLMTSVFSQATTCVSYPQDCSQAGGDQDMDGLCTDYEEYVYLTDSMDPDTDNGNKCDGDEIWLAASDPFYPGDDLA